MDEALFEFPDPVDPDGLFQLEHETRPDRLDDRRRAALLALLDVIEIAVLGGVDVHDGPSAGNGRHLIVEELFAGDQDARSPRSSDELVGRDEDRVEIGEWIIVRRGHVDSDIRGCCREVPE